MIDATKLKQMMEAAQPLVDFLHAHAHPNCQIVVSIDRVDMYECLAASPLDVEPPPPVSALSPRLEPVLQSLAGLVGDGHDHGLPPRVLEVAAAIGYPTTRDGQGRFHEGRLRALVERFHVHNSIRRFAFEAATAFLHPLCLLDRETGAGAGYADPEVNARWAAYWTHI